MKKTLGLILLLTLVAIPIVTYGQAGDVCHQAQRDARHDVNDTLWFTLGCLFGVFGLGAAYLILPSPSAARMVGKSSEYVNVYIDCYKDRARDIQVKKSFNGCLIWSIVALLGGGGVALSGCLL